MLSPEVNERLTRVGPVTPMGTTMRRYWIPALLCSEIAEPDGPPVRVKLLGERLVAFRDTRGQVGLVQEHCPHRCASLFLGRNEEGGLRCVYHGWKFDVQGRCIDMPTERSTSNFPSKIRLVAYPTLELGGVVWTYLGPAGRMPPPPRFEWAVLPETHRIVTKSWQECNWLQTVEGGVDSFHVAWLHRAVNPATSRIGVRGIWTKPSEIDDEVDMTDYGLRYASTRLLPSGQQWVRVYHMILPFHVIFPLQIGLGVEGTQNFTPMVSGHFGVPIDDENTMVYNWTARFGADPLTDHERKRRELEGGRSPGALTSDARKVWDRHRDWGIDRLVQKLETYSGIEGVDAQDHAVQESMGPIVDRSLEHLGSTDRAVISLRKALLAAIKAVEAGNDPPGVGRSLYRLRAIEKIIDSGLDWRNELASEYEIAALDP